MPIKKCQNCVSVHASVRRFNFFKFFFCYRRTAELLLISLGFRIRVFSSYDLHRCCDLFTVFAYRERQSEYCWFLSLDVSSPRLLTPWFPLYFRHEMCSHPSSMFRRQHVSPEYIIRPRCVQNNYRFRALASVDATMTVIFYVYLFFFSVRHIS